MASPRLYPYYFKNQFSLFFKLNILRSLKIFLWVVLYLCLHMTLLVHAAHLKSPPPKKKLQTTTVKQVNIVLHSPPTLLLLSYPSKKPHQEQLFKHHKCPIFFSLKSLVAVRILIILIWQKKQVIYEIHVFLL